MKEIVLKVKEIAESACKKYNLELFDIKYYNKSGKWFLEIVIDNPLDYVSTKDCENISREVEFQLDELDIIPQRYYLTVSSPGLDRPLRSIDDFKRFINNKVKIKLENETIIGYIKDVKDSVIFLEENNKKIKEIKYTQIKKANLEIDI
ncbi:ribosome maturation factor RimP [Thermosipho japonicus]|uniref:Ribosome maturation factor RimP n=1 Tax=Thermosipho japonicus TaxID=90323 RepID=A0A841GQP0_9BACT|nr:ribosome maturation factor [Thermosipho japonicus]MBB6061698.1 ribosome maturation factor RimP [Thermosipho japonicus]